MTFPTGVIDIRKCSDEELKTMLDEAREASKHSRKLGRVMGIVAAHRLKHMREFLMYEELAIWRRMNGFDRVAEDEESCFYAHRSLPPTPEEYAASLWSEVNALKDAISMPRHKVSKLINAIEQGKLSDGEYAILKRLVEKRDREAAQVTAITRDDTVQHCSPISQTPEPPSVVYFNLENEERMELDELKSSSAGTSLETPGQQCPPIEGIWETEKTTASGILTGAGPSRGENISSPAERENSTTTAADISSKAATAPKRRHKTFSKQNKQFDPGGSGEKVPPWNAAVTLPFFFWGELGSSLLLSVCASCSVPCVCLFSEIIFFPQVITSQRN